MPKQSTYPDKANPAGTEILTAADGITTVAITLDNLPLSDDTVAALGGKAASSHPHGVADITGTKAEFDTAVTDGSIVYVGDVTSNVDTNLSTSQTATTVDVISSDGTDATLPQAIASGNAGVMSGVDKDKLDGIEVLADVTDTANVDAAGATMNADTTTAAMGFVIDEDDMVSDSNSKLPTQQSVKAYSDTLAEILSWCFSGSKSGDAAASIYLERGSAVDTNLSPFVIPVACELKRITARSDASGAGDAWTAEIYKNGASVATVAVTSNKGVSGLLSVSFAAGDDIALYFTHTGSNIKNPTINAFFVETL